MKDAQLEPVLQAIAATNALEECEKQAQQACDEAIASLAVLPPSEFKEALISLCHKALQRQN